MAVVIVIICKTQSVIQILDISYLLLHAYDRTKLASVHGIEAAFFHAWFCDNAVFKIIKWYGVIYHHRYVFVVRRGIAVEAVELEFFVDKIS